MKNEGNLGYHSIALCGYRKLGKILYEKLIRQGVEIPYIIERNYQALSVLDAYIGKRIVGFQMSKEYYHQAEAILLTGDIPDETVCEALRLAGIDIPIITSVEV